MSTSVLWRVADEVGHVPLPLTMTDDDIRALITDWWTQPRVFGCATAANQSECFVIAPNPEVVCGFCAPTVLQSQTQCALCRADLDEAGALYVVEVGRFVIFVTTCSTCETQTNESEADDA